MLVALTWVEIMIDWEEWTNREWTMESCDVVIYWQESIDVWILSGRMNPMIKQYIKERSSMGYKCY